MRSHRPAGLAAIPPVLVTLAVALVAAAPAAARGRVEIRTARNATLDHRILVNRRGHTLYSLSAERHGRFICSNRACLSLWTPLALHRHQRPSGARHLGRIRRPDGTLQVTYRGRPLYTFNGDRRRGDVMGEGFRDVGVWHAARA